MAVELIADAGAADANSYCTAAQAETYFETRLHKDSWDDALSDNKEIALIWATRLLDQMVTWNGSQSTTTQALRWPRSFVPDPDTGRYLATATIPQWLVNATAELAMWLLENDTTAKTESGALSSVKVGPIAVEYEKHTTPPRAPLPAPVWDIIRGYCGGSRRQRYLVRA